MTREEILALENSNSTFVLLQQALATSVGKVEELQAKYDATAVESSVNAKLLASARDEADQYSSKIGAIDTLLLEAKEIGAPIEAVISALDEDGTAKMSAKLIDSLDEEALPASASEIDKEAAEIAAIMRSV